MEKIKASRREQLGRTSELLGNCFEVCPLQGNGACLISGFDRWWDLDQSAFTLLLAGASTGIENGGRAFKLEAA